MSENTPNKQHPWITREASYKQTLTYLEDRRMGRVTSLITPWPRLNAIGVNGWEWGTAIAFCARPAVGKSVLVDELCQKVGELNPGIRLRKLKFELEMVSQVTAIREFSSILEKPYAYVCSAEDGIDIGPSGEVLGKSKFSKKELLKCWEYVQRKMARDEVTKDLKNPEDIIERSPTVEEFVEIVHAYMEAYKYIDEKGKERYAHTIVTIDHLRLLEWGKFSNEKDMLYAACKAINMLKRQFGYPIIFVALNHLVRDVNSEARCEEGAHANYLRDSDIFGADALIQNFDMIVVMDRPAARNISKYGPLNYIIENSDEGRSLLCFQFVKVRNGVPGMSWFRGEFDKMRIVEADTPARAQLKVQTKLEFKK